MDPERERRIAVSDVLTDVIAAALPHAQDLACERELLGVHDLIARPAAERQLRGARRTKRLPGLVEEMAAQFTA